MPITSFARPRSDYGVARHLVFLFELAYFLAVQQQLAVAAFGVVIVGAIEILGYIHVFDPHFAVVDVAERVDQRRLSESDALDFGAGQNDAGGEGVANGIIECSPAVFYINFFEFHN